MDDEGKIEKTTDYEYLAISEKGKNIASITGVMLSDESDFEEKIYEYVNTRLNELGYV